MRGAFLAAALLLLAGCAATGPSANPERLALTELLGVRFDEPFGGTPPKDQFGISGTTSVPDWVEPDDRPRVKGRAYRFPGAGVFDSKEDWTVEEWVNRKTGAVETVAARLDLEQGRLRKTPGTDTVLRLGLAIRDYFDFILGAPVAERCRDATGRLVPSQPKGPFEQNYLWISGPQAVRLGLFFADGTDDATDGRVTIEVQRLDALPLTTRARVLTEWGVEQQ